MRTKPETEEEASEKSGNDEAENAQGFETHLSLFVNLIHIPLIPERTAVTVSVTSFQEVTASAKVASSASKEEANSK